LVFGVRAPNARAHSLKPIAVIAGFNTDIEFNGVVYHVQTEDKGAPAHQIMSLVYDRGTILASKRASYDDLIGHDINEKQLATRVSRQHQLICAAIRAGRIDELKELSGQKSLSGSASLAHQTVAIETAVPEAALIAEPPTARAAELFSMDPEHTLDPFADEPVIDPIGVIEEPIVLPADAVAIISELAGRERRTHNRLSLEFLGETQFHGGDQRMVNVMVCRGTARKVVSGAEIMIKIVGASFRPVIYHARSDANGLATLHIEIPLFQTGRAALLVRALNEGEEVELRRLVTAADS
jgi:hypothetical protein